MNLDTSITEPSFDAGEAEMLLFALDRSRATFAWKVGDLDPDALHRPFPPSAMTLAGLLKHLAYVEDTRTSTTLTGQPMGELDPRWDGIDPESVWTNDDAPDDLYQLWTDAVARSRAAWAKALTDPGILDEPTVWTSPSGKSPNVRRFLVDLQDEYARHLGHADLMREAIDGRVGEDPPQ